jgi:mono/diheme cytochrome c family protein
LQCHGLTGDGRGPTGLWVQPHPRDFRRGLFKFVSAGNGSGKPRRADLMRTVEAGLPGTAMPSFGMLPEDERDKIVSYVIHLSVRGQVEYGLLRTLLAEGEDGLDGDVASEAQALLKTCLRQWGEAASAPAVTAFGENDDADPEGVRRGWELFAAPGAAGCLSCHEDYGRQAKHRFDMWGTVVRPADLTAGTYKGGKRPVDLASRVRCGIAPSGMPAVVSYDDDQVRDLVRFVRAMPTPKLLPPDVRAKVYGTPAGDDASR